MKRNTPYSITPIDANTMFLPRVQHYTPFSRLREFFLILLTIRVQVAEKNIFCEIQDGVSNAKALAIYILTPHCLTLLFAGQYL